MGQGAASKTGQRIVTARERQARAVELRVRGWTLEQIAAELQYRGTSSVSEAIKAQLARRERPAADELAKIHLERLELAIRPVMDKIQEHITGKRVLSVKQISALQLALVRNLAQQAKYVDVYSEGQGLGPVVSLLDRLLSTTPVGFDPDDPMTITGDYVEPGDNA